MIISSQVDELRLSSSFKFTNLLRFSVSPFLRFFYSPLSPPLFLFFLLFAFPATAQTPTNLETVDPTIGNVGILLQPTRPTVHLPNQMVRFYPVRADYLDDQISFFPLTISSHRKGELFGVMPYLGEPKAETWGKRQTYDHDLEITRPFYYSTYFIDNDIKTEFTPGAKCGIFRFSFPGKGEKCLALRIVNQGSWEMGDEGTKGRGNEGVTERSKDGKTKGLRDWETVGLVNSFSGTEEFMGMKAYVYGEVNQAGQAGKLNLQVSDPKRGESQAKPGAWIRFGANTPSEVVLKYAISFISIQQAKANLAAEIPAWDFDGIRKNAEQKWTTVMDQIKVKGGTEAQRRTFYTSLYRQYERMININEHGQYYSGYDHKVHPTSRDFFVDDWIWDTYLAMHPLRSILHPEMEGDMLQSYVTMYEQGGWLPQFPLLFMDDPAMNGFHSTATLLDGYRKGIRNFDVPKAYEAMLKNATQATMLPWRNGTKYILDTFYREKGFYPALWPGQSETVKMVHSFEHRQSVAITLAHSFDDWALSEMAGELKKPEESAYYRKQSLNYRNLYRADKKLMWPKDSAGNWIDIDPKFDGGPGGRDYYDENNGYTYAWQAQHDLSGLIGMMGGREGFTATLDQLFREPLGRSKYAFFAKFPDGTGMVGQYSMGNEPSFFIPYLYNYSGEPWKTQKRIRFLLDVWFKDNIFGIPGDEDGGGMTAFVVFSSMGFYPVTPGLPNYNIGSPLFEEVKISLENGKIFTIKAPGCSVKNKYIQSAKLNGKTLNKPWFTHDELMNGALLELQMGELPNKRWGAGANDAPPSGVSK
jgi:predicted alpha-1,2-mannosidase